MDDKAMPWLTPMCQINRLIHVVGMLDGGREDARVAAAIAELDDITELSG